MIPRQALVPVARLGARLPVLINRRWPGFRNAKSFLLRRLRRDQMVVHGHLVHNDATDSLRLGLGEEHEAAIVRYLDHCLAPGDLVVDGGAHIGYHSLHMARAVGSNGRVLAFEPDPANFALLERNLAAIFTVGADGPSDPGYIFLFNGETAGLTSGHTLVVATAIFDDNACMAQELRGPRLECYIIR